MEEFTQIDEQSDFNYIEDNLKPRNKPQLVEITPNFSGRRYEVDEFNQPSRSSKPAAFETVDPDTYSNAANCACFLTSISRLPFWIKALNLRYLEHLQASGQYQVKWQEKNTALTLSEDKCERLVVHVYFKEGGHLVLLFAVTVFLTTGRIQIQGNFRKEFASDEMPLLSSIVNKLQDEGDQAQVEGLQSQAFFYNTTQSEDLLQAKRFEEEGEVMRNETSSVFRNEAAKNTANDGFTVLAPKPVTMTKTNENGDLNGDGNLEHGSQPNSIDINESMLSPSRVNSFTMMKETLTSIEREVVDIRLELENRVHCDDLSDLRDKQKQIENTIKVNHQKYEREIENLSEENTMLKQEIEEIKKMVKKIQENKSSQAQQIKSIQSNHIELQEQHSTLTNEVETLKKKYEEDESGSETGSDISEDEHGTVQDLDQKSENKNTDDANSNKTQSQNQTTPRATETTNSSKQPFTANNHNQDNTTQSTQSSLLFLCDSNGKYLRMNKLCPKHNAIYQRCPTIEDATSLIQDIDANQNTPEIILIHTGTNDLEHNTDPKSMSENIYRMLSLTASIFPQSKIIYSTLLPRNDYLNSNVADVNRLLDQNIRSLENVYLIHHTNLLSTKEPLLHDKKHLNRTGVNIFARGLTRAVYKGVFSSTHQTLSRSNLRSDQTHNQIYSPANRRSAQNVYNPGYNPRSNRRFDNNFQPSRRSDYNQSIQSRTPQAKQAFGAERDFTPAFRPNTVSYSNAVKQPAPSGQNFGTGPPVMQPDIMHAFSLLQNFFSRQFRAP